MTDQPSPDSESGAPLLTEDEHQLVKMLGECANAYGRICGGAYTRSHDMAEFVAHVHDLQNTVLAQAAARAYPASYRLAGERITSTFVVAESLESSRV